MTDQEYLIKSGFNSVQAESDTDAWKPPKSMPENNSEKALIFRITHIKNVPWILANGVHCCNSKCQDPNFCGIGNSDIISKRAQKEVPIPPGGCLSDYVPFYFTTHTPMLLNIKTGYNGLKITPMPDIAILVTSLHKIIEENLKFVFTDCHALVRAAQFSNDLEDLDRIDWAIIKARDFQKDTDDPGKSERYQAEALIYRLLPTSALLGIGCYGPKQQKVLQEEAERIGVATPIVVKNGWYF